MATIPELLDGHVTLEVGALVTVCTSTAISAKSRRSLVDVYEISIGEASAIPDGSGAGVGELPQCSKGGAEQENIPVYPFKHKEGNRLLASDFRRQRQVRDGIVFIGVAQEKAQEAFNGKNRLGGWD